MPKRSISVVATVPAPAEQIFDVLADPSRHPMIDGSGSVRAPRPDAPDRLALGSTFGMDMKIGLAYRIENVVVEFEENRLIAWRHFNGHRWRWRLTPLSDGTTEVTETFDWSTARLPLLLDLSPVPRRNKAAMERSLNRLSALFGATA
ncbi:SRPBCC family protein [Lentzea sp. BCCO 10_0061]|uniref:SRPBCC family protein n=1 Tax=Lentzea sokolovensis TaxID=3095429 RepID=A0ABU4UMS3_9PSEU|nr:SRPBCC family protein [Lentzea sp. BCCO 10_0061]MDX8140595.1 SRPBCC family protein [Lentzea sp. BCCO 10_0061]